MTGPEPPQAALTPKSARSPRAKPLRRALVLGVAQFISQEHWKQANLTMPTLHRVTKPAVPEPASLYYAIRYAFALHSNKLIGRGSGGRCCVWCGELWPCDQICLAAGLLGGL